MIKLIIADDHQVFLDGIIELISKEDHIEVMGQANTGKQVLELLQTNTPDIILMDINMPEMDGIETTQMVKQKYPELKIIMLTMHETHQYIRKLLETGVDGYLLKTTSKNELIEAIKTVMDGKNYYGKAVQDTFMNSFNSNKVVSDIKLTRREKEILELICEELSTNEIAEKLFISAYTVETHRKNLLSKTGSKNVAGLVKFAMLNKFI